MRLCAGAVDETPFVRQRDGVLKVALTLLIVSGRNTVIVSIGRFTAITAAFAALLNGCSLSKPCHVPAAQERKEIHVVRRGWHTGIVIDVHDWPDRTWPLLADFPGANYLEFGWGEARYYQAERPNWRMALAAALRPNPSVVEVRALEALERQPARDYAVVAVSVSATGFKAMTDSIAATFAPATANGAGVVRTGVEWHHGDQHVRFYRARGKFFFPRMCNRWTARRLCDGGCAVRVATVVSAGRVIREARACAAAQHAQREPR